MQRRVKLFDSPFLNAPANVVGRSKIEARRLIVSPVRPPSAFQRQIIECDRDLVLVGGRGGGKSYGVALRLADQINKYKRRYRALYVRKTYDAIEDFEEVCQDVFGAHCPGTYNIQKKAWRFDNGAFLKFSQLELEKDYRKLQGKTFGALIVDEACQFAEPTLLDRLLSNIRGPKGLPLTRTLLANPGDVGHWWIYDRYIKGRTHGEPYRDNDCDRPVVTLHSTYRDNPHQDNESYEAMLRSSTATDAELRKAYMDGDWDIARGAFFGSVLDKSRSEIPRWGKLPEGWLHYLSMDYGTASPCAVYLLAVSEGGLHEGYYYPRGSIVVVDELYMAEKKGSSKGINLTIPQQADRIKAFCATWGISTRNGYNVADDACFTEDGRKSIATLFAEEDISFKKAGKGDRLTGWEHMRILLLNAGTEKPGLYATNACESFWAVMPSVPRDPKKPNDVDTKSNDHIADCIRYGCLATIERSESRGGGLRWS